jgi:type IV pilus assembly protein PilX
MLNAQKIRRQQGVVLLLSLIVLVAMSLAGIGLMRGILTGNRVVGNLAFQQSATQSADVGIETAIAWLEQKTRELKQANPPQLQNDLFLAQEKSAGSGFNYRPMREDPGASQSWEDYWGAAAKAGSQVNTLAVDAAGNTVSFLIHRLCREAGDSLTAGCESSPSLNNSTQSSSKSGGIKLQVPDQVYYRITVRVQGPRNAVSFVQAMVAM